MRIAVIADIHGNLPALDAVLADIAARGVDLTVNLGDIVSGPLFPRETADRLMPLGLPTIRGNHERQLLTHGPDRIGLSDRFARAALTASHKAWLASLPETLRVGNDILLVHGTPASDLEYFLETVDAADEEPVPHNVEVGTPEARYAIIGIGTEIAVEMMTVAYDWEMAAQAAEANGRM